MRGSMEGYLQGFAKNGLYDSGIDLRDRMRRVTKEFRGQVLAAEQTRQADERALLKTASAKVQRKLKAHWKGERQQIAAQCAASADGIRADNAIHMQTLERDIAHAPQPRIKFSKDLLDQKTAEHQLCKQHRFEEAKEVRRRADKVQRKEEAAHDAWVQAEEDLLRTRQVAKAAELEHERSMVAKQCALNAAHKQDLDVKTTAWRMAHNAKDMRHAHVVDTYMSKHYLTANMASAHPVEKVRAGHGRTGSSLKGTHMHKATNEGRAAASSLTATHRFENRVDGTDELDAVVARTMDRTARASARAFGLRQGGLGGTL